MPLAMSAAFLVPLALVASSCAGAAADEARKLPSIEFIGKGYNIFLGNPRALEGKPDTGFMSDVLELTYNDEAKIGQDAWLIPDGTNGVEVGTCADTFNVRKMFGVRNYSDSLKLAVGANFDFAKWVAAFSASADYKSMKDDMENRKYIKMEASATCTVYSIWAEAFTPPRATDNFIQAVRELPTIYDAGSVQEFIRHFGTHIMYGADFGGVWGQVSSFTRESWYKMNSNMHGFEVDGNAALSALVSAGGKLSSAADKTKAENFTKFRKLEQGFFKGGSYHQNKPEWINSVRSRPAPITYRLWSLDEAVDSRFMPDSGMAKATLEAKRQNIAKGLENYCRHLLTTGEVTSCEAPDPDPIPEAPKVVKLDWARNGWPFGASHEYKCPPSTYITMMKWRQVRNQRGLVDLTVTCSDEYSTPLTWTKDLGGVWNGPVTCSGGFGGIQAQKLNGFKFPFNSGVTNVKMYCVGEDKGRKSNDSWGRWKPVQTCPEDTPVLAGLEVLAVKDFGIYNYRPICSNGNFLRRLQARVLV